MSQDSSNSMESIQIVDVTEVYDQGINQAGEVLMDDIEELPMETVVTFPSEAEAARRAELVELPRDQLIEIILQCERDLRKRNKVIHRLRQNGKMGRQASTSSAEPEVEMADRLSPVKDNGEMGKGKKRKAFNNRELDFAAYGKRHVALRFLYLGWDYHGYVVQDETDNTIEDHIFAALAKTKLIQSRETSHYHRCGRTDKCVSAFSQVISLHVRSTASVGRGLIHPASPLKATPSEIPYLQILNGVLPKNIRFTAWSPVEEDFSARFSCGGRKYRYFFPRANLDLNRMNAAAELLLGEHDFRNFCKADINGGVTNYVRRIEKIFVEQCSTSPLSPSSPSSSSSSPRFDRSQVGDSRYDMCVLHVYGSAFLWHQVRSIVALLFLVGQGKEDPSVISELLNVEEYPAKPQYVMAEGFPLVLFDCAFKEPLWESDEFTLRQTVKEIEKIWTEHAVKSVMIRSMLESVKERLGKVSLLATDAGTLLQGLLPEGKGRVYQPLRTRKMCDTIENRLKKKKLKDAVNV